MGWQKADPNLDERLAHILHPMCGVGTGFEFLLRCLEHSDLSAVGDPCDNAH
jgi:hypothetical protein